MQMMYEEASQVAVDAVVSIKTIASFCSQKRVVTIYNDKCEASRIQGIRTGIVGGLGFGFSNLMVYTSSALCYFVGAQFISHGKSTFSGVFKVISMHQHIFRASDGQHRWQLANWGLIAPFNNIIGSNLSPFQLHLSLNFNLLFSDLF